MSENLGAFDRTLRMFFGLLLLALAVSGTIGPWGYLGAIPLATAFIGTCPLYSIFGWSTCRSSGAHER